MPKNPTFIFLLLVSIFLSACNLPVSAPVSTAVATAAPCACDASDVLLARMGRGELLNAVYSPDGEFVLAVFSTGVSVAKRSTLKEISFYSPPDEPRSLAFFPDGHEVAIGTAHGQLLFIQFAPESGQLTVPTRPALQAKDASNIPNDPFSINNLLLSADGRYLAVSTAAQVQIWDLRSGQPLLKQRLAFTGPEIYPRNIKRARPVSTLPEGYTAFSLSFSSNSRYLLAGVFLLELESARIIWRSQGLGSSFLADGLHIAFKDLDVSRSSTNYQILDIVTLKTEKTIQLAELPGEGAELAFSPNGEYVLEAVSDNKTFMLYRAATGELIKTFTNQNPSALVGLYSIDVSNNGLVVILLAAQPLGRITPFMFDLSKDTPAAFTITSEIPNDYHQISRLFSPNGLSFLYYSGAWLAQADPSVKRIASLLDNAPAGSVTALAFSPDGSGLVVGKDPASLSVYATRPMRLWKNLNLVDNNLPSARRTPAGLSGLAFLPDGERLAFITSPGWLSLWSPGESDPPVLLKPVDAAIEQYGLAVSPDGQSMAVGGFERAVRLWKDMPGGSASSSLLEDSNPVSALAYAPDGKLLAAGTAKGFIRLWDPASGLLLRTLKGHSDWISGLVFTPAGDNLVSVSTDGTVRMWRVSDGSQLRLLELGQPIASLALDPLGQLFALGGQDGNVYFWSLESNTWLGSARAGNAGVSALAFSADGARLALGLTNGQIQILQFRDAFGKLMVLSPGQPQTVTRSESDSVCQIPLPNLLSESSTAAGGRFINETAAQAVYQTGGSYELSWLLPYLGDCSFPGTKLPVNIPRISAPTSVDQLGVVTAADFRFEDLGEGLLRVTATVEIPASAGSFDASWKLTIPSGSFTLAARLTSLDMSGLPGLPAPLYYIDHGAIMRLETDGLTRSQVVESPVQCMDISPQDGSLAFLKDDELILADARGAQRRVLLPVAGCPSWSPDGALIAYVLNGVKRVQVSSGQMATLRDDLNVNNKDLRLYTGILGWSPFSNKFIAQASAWDSLATVIFDVPTSNRFALQGSADVAWSRNGEFVYEGKSGYDCISHAPPYLIRTNVVTGQSETLMGGSSTDLRGAQAPFESSDGRLLFFGSRPGGNSCASSLPVQSVLVPAKMTLESSAQVQYDDNITLEKFKSALWWQDGSLVLVSLGNEDIARAQPLTVLIARPFSSQPLIHLPVNGSNLRWGR